jgi:hypothetical protein
VAVTMVVQEAAADRQADIEGSRSTPKLGHTTLRAWRWQQGAQPRSILETHL